MAARGSCAACTSPFKVYKKKTYKRYSLQAHVQENVQVNDAVELLLGTPINLDTSTHFLCQRCFILIRGWYSKYSTGMQLKESFMSVL